MKGWQVQTLGEVIVPNGTIDPTKAPDRPFRYVDVSSVSNETFEIQETQQLQGREAPSRARRLIRAGDVLFATIRPTLKRIAIVPPELDGEVCSTGYFVFRTRPFLDGRFLFYHLFSDEFSSAMERLQTGASYPAVNDAQIKGETIAFPPLDEQWRIVAILDEAFAGLAEMRQHAETNLKNARALFDSHLNAIFSQRGEGWMETTLGNSCKLSSGGTPSKDNASFWTGDIPWVSGRDMKRDRLDDAMLHISEAAVTESATRIAPTGSLLMLVRGMGLANGFAIAELLKPCAFNQDIKAIQPGKNIVSRFLLFSLRHGLKEAPDVLSNAAHGTLKIDVDRLSEVKLLLPDAKAQEKLVISIDALAHEVSRLETLYRQKLAAIDELKQSILHRAFSGALTRGATATIAAPAIPVQAANDNRNTTAMVLAFAFERHKRANRDRSFGHVKAQKILHMVEAEAGYDLGRIPVRDAAGPNDFPHMLAADEWAEESEHYSFTKIGEGYTFKPLANFEALTKQARAIDPTTRTKIERIIDLFIPMDMQQSELFATVYAAWNNLLIEGKSVTDDAIIRAAREDWHVSKLKIDRAEFVKALRLIRGKNCTPSGQGKFVPPPSQSELFA